MRLERTLALAGTTPFGPVVSSARNGTTTGLGLARIQP